MRSTILKAGIAVTATAALIGGPALASALTPSTATTVAEYRAAREFEGAAMVEPHNAWMADQWRQAEEDREAKKKAAEKKKREKAEAKAAAKAEAKRKAQAERKAAEERAARARASQGGTPAQNRALGMQMCADKGWSNSQCSDLDRLWTKESGWSSKAHNSSSGAHGIPQALPGSKMSSHGSDWATNPRVQIAWGMDYIAGRYGNPSNAWAHSRSHGWY